MSFAAQDICDHINKKMAEKQGKASSMCEFPSVFVHVVLICITGNPASACFVLCWRTGFWITNLG